MSISPINEFPTHNEIKIVLDDTYILKYNNNIHILESSNPAHNLDRINIILTPLFIYN